MSNSITYNDKVVEITKSNQLYERALKCMHPVTQTIAKGPTQFVNGVAPKYLERAEGVKVWDVDGNEFLDFNMAIGPISLGYCHPDVDSAIMEQLKKGISFSLMHRLEAEVSELIHNTIPNAESVRISKTGADVCSAAIRIARAYTGRDKVLCCGYHGWHDWYIGTTSKNKGIPKAVRDLTSTFPYNDLDTLKKLLTDEVACVIMEPMIFEHPNPGYLEGVQELCKQNNTLFIFDEMWTGFRFALGGAQEYFNIKPDLAVYSKAVANGMPVSFLTGKEEIMKEFEDNVFFFTTFGGEALSLAATKATIEFMKSHDVFGHIQGLGKILIESFNQIIKEHQLEKITKCVGHPARTMIMFYDQENASALEIKSFVQQELITKFKILWGGFHNLCYSHSKEDIDYLINALNDVLLSTKNNIESNKLKSEIRGEVIQPVFRKTN